MSSDMNDKINTINSDLIRGHINTIILNILYENDRYGYDIIQQIEIKTNGQYQLKQPTLYSALKRLEQLDYLSSYWGIGMSNGGRRKYYQITDKGRAYVEQNRAEWEYSRTIIDNLVSNKPFDFQNSSIPNDIDFTILKKMQSRKEQKNNIENTDNSTDFHLENVQSNENISTYNSLEESSIKNLNYSAEDNESDSALIKNSSNNSSLHKNMHNCNLDRVEQEYATLINNDCRSSSHSTISQDDKNVTKADPIAENSQQSQQENFANTSIHSLEENSPLSQQIEYSAKNLQSNAMEYTATDFPYASTFSSLEEEDKFAQYKSENATIEQILEIVKRENNPFAAEVENDYSCQHEHFESPASQEEEQMIKDILHSIENDAMEKEKRKQDKIFNTIAEYASVRALPDENTFFPDNIVSNALFEMENTATYNTLKVREANAHQGDMQNKQMHENYLRLIGNYKEEQLQYFSETNTALEDLPISSKNSSPLSLYSQNKQSIWANENINEQNFVQSLQNFPSPHDIRDDLLQQLQNGHTHTQETDLEREKIYKTLAANTTSNIEELEKREMQHYFSSLQNAMQSQKKYNLLYTNKKFFIILLSIIFALAIVEIIILASLTNKFQANIQFAISSAILFVIAYLVCLIFIFKTKSIEIFKTLATKKYMLFTILFYLLAIGISIFTLYLLSSAYRGRLESDFWFYIVGFNILTFNIPLLSIIYYFVKKYKK